MMNPEHTSSTPALDRLARRLQDNGMVVLPYSDHIEIRLPIFASVQVRIIDGRLSCEPRFGFLPRDRATWLTVIGIAAVTAAAFLDLGITPLSMMLGFLGMSSGTSTAIRYQVTESCITRVQTAYMLITAGQSNAQRAIGTSTARPAHPELGEAAPRMTSGERRAAEVRRRDR
jgi:hypothetical protein